LLQECQDATAVKSPDPSW